MIIGIHQPNFMPWYPYFEKIKRCEIFVILKHCQFEKNNYQNRFFFQDNWYTMSVKKGMEPITHKTYIDPFSDFNKIKAKLKKYNSFFDQFDFCLDLNLATTNICIIKNICKILNIRTTIVEDYATDLKGTERLIDICKHYGGSKYLAGSGGKNYMDLDLFAKSNIEVSFSDLYQDKRHVFEIVN